jgi:hypothetical protein
LTARDDSLWRAAARRVFASLVNDEKSMEFAFAFIRQALPLAFLANVLEVLFEIAPKTEDVLDALLESVIVNVPISPPKVDSSVLVFMEVSSRLCTLFPDFIGSKIDFLVSKGHVPFAFYIGSWTGEIFPQIEDQITPKLTLSLLSFSVLKLASAIGAAKDFPSLKTVFTFYKNLSDPELIEYATPLVLNIVNFQVSSQTVKYMSSFFGPLLKRLKGANFSTEFSRFLHACLQIPDGPQLLRP